MIKIGDIGSWGYFQNIVISKINEVSVTMLNKLCESKEIPRIMFDEHWMPARRKK